MRVRHGALVVLCEERGPHRGPNRAPPATENRGPGGGILKKIDAAY